MHRFLTTCLSILLASGASPLVAFNDDAAADAWMNAYLWIQDGRGHQEKGQIPLALASYQEALRQLDLVAERYPGYEEQMVQFRIGTLRADITKMETGLSPNGQKIRDDYLAFIRLVDRADDERLHADHAKSLATLKEAQTLLSGLVRSDPETLHPALSEQEKRLGENIAWIDQLINRPRHAPSLVLAGLSPSGMAARGTTEFISDKDLPDDPGTVSKNLFPR